MTEMRIGDQTLRCDPDTIAAIYEGLEHGFAEECGCVFCKNAGATRPALSYAVVGPTTGSSSGNGSGSGLGLSGSGSGSGEGRSELDKDAARSTRIQVGRAKLGAAATNSIISAGNGAGDGNGHIARIRHHNGLLWAGCANRLRRESQSAGGERELGYADSRAGAGEDYR